MDDIIKYVIVPYLTNAKDVHNVTQCLSDEKPYVKVSLKRSVPLNLSMYNVQSLKLDTHACRNKLDDSKLKLMPNLHTLIATYDNNITNQGLSYIPNIVFLSLANNTNITDKGLIYFKKIHTLKMQSNTNITETGIEYLSKYPTLKILTLGYKSHKDSAQLKSLANIVLPDVVVVFKNSHNYFNFYDYRWGYNTLTYND